MMRWTLGVQGAHIGKYPARSQLRIYLLTTKQAKQDHVHCETVASAAPQVSFPDEIFKVLYFKNQFEQER
jgi:hypothetical protein